MSKFEDLQALGKMLDEGKISQDEYERLKADLLAEASESGDPMKGKPPGWYNDPSGKATHQAYWDGETWTGQTRTQFQADQTKAAEPNPKPVYRRAWFWVLAVLVVLVALSQLGDGGSDVEEVFDDVAAGLDDDTSAEDDTPAATSPPGGFASFTVNGTGDDVIDFSIPGNQPAALTLTHSGSSNFAVTSYTAGNSRIDLLVNEIGSYRGTVAVNFLEGEEVGVLEITADGSWSIVAEYIGDLPLRTGSASGTGDDVVRINISSPSVSLTHNGDSNFAIVVWSPSGRDLVVNEIGPYSGTVRTDTGMVFFEINADGDWTIDS